MKFLGKIIKVMILVFTIVIAKSSTDVSVRAVENDNLNKTVDLSTMALKVDEVNKNDKYYVIDTFTGDLTGYAYNCPLCNGTLACLPKYNIKNGTLKYNDYEYGEVHIVASSRKLKCGSIISFESKRVGEGTQYAIVLDRGVLGYALDLLTESEAYASKYIGRSKITYNLLRSGWE